MDWFVFTQLAPFAQAVFSMLFLCKWFLSNIHIHSYSSLCIEEQLVDSILPKDI